jgi:hypothetical protein
VDPRAGLDDVEKRKFLTLPGLELRPLGGPALSQSLHRLRYPGPFFKSFVPFKYHANTSARESIVTVSLFYQLESFSSCFAVLMKQNLMFALCTFNTNYHNDLQGKVFPVLN